LAKEVGTEPVVIQGSIDLVNALERVSCVLEDAIRLFTEGNLQQACRCLEEANNIIESCEPEMKLEVESAVVAIVDSKSSRPVGWEGMSLARAATA
jgi:hypothetical protein